MNKMEEGIQKKKKKPKILDTKESGKKWSLKSS
jgi:hypothetical protein